MTEMDAAEADAAFAECCDLVREMTKIYGADEDAQRVRDLDAAMERAQNQHDAHEREMESAIRELARRCKVAERKATGGEESGGGAPERELGRRRDEIKSKKQRMDVVVNEEIPATKREVSLYAHISNIAWHYEERNRVVGRVNARASRDVRSIDMPLRPGNEFRVANALWEMMD
ncbi:hypothetical protein BE221DRAFT_77587 [Ostreococcus tauri]|uniref:Kinetochore protein Spc24 n=1 Tax=Ostreococcus tauri TaxID=70448 RepID=A0A1Y5I995_OSTTA|nr:hypothetical protein BE221DRAFT_77587 [Ostreococcus tauri]